MLGPFYRLPLLKYTTLLWHHVLWHEQLGVQRYLLYVHERLGGFLQNPLIEVRAAASLAPRLHLAGQEDGRERRRRPAAHARARWGDAHGGLSEHSAAVRFAPLQALVGSGVLTVVHYTDMSKHESGPYYASHTDDYLMQVRGERGGVLVWPDDYLR